MALSRPVTALDNERFTVQSVMLKYAVPIVLVSLIFKVPIAVDSVVPELANKQVRTSSLRS